MEVDVPMDAATSGDHGDVPFLKKRKVIEEVYEDLDPTVFTKIDPAPMPRGAEAIITRCIYLGKDAIYKRRLPKSYRCQTINDALTKDRTKAELRGLKRCKEIGVTCPAVYFVDVSKFEFVIQYIPGVTLRDYLLKGEHGLPNEEYKAGLDRISVNIGRLIGTMHKGGLIHGDLTSANMILRNDSTEDIVLIDFGLCYNKNAAEDKAVDLYVLEKSLNALHDAGESTFDAIRRGYEEGDPKDGKTVYKKLEEVRLRGRKRDMVG